MFAITYLIISEIINNVKIVIKLTINIFITFQTFSLLAYLDKFFDKYPITKKKIKDAIEAPAPNKIFWCKTKFFEKFPKKTLCQNKHEDLNM